MLKKYLKNYFEYIKFYVLYIGHKLGNRSESVCEFVFQFYIYNFMFKHIESENFSYKKNKNILSKAKNLYEKFSNIYPENFMFHRVMSRAYIYNCKREFINCHRKLINISDKRIKELKNKFEIIEPGYALTTIGSIFTLDAYIKSIKLTHFKSL